MRTHLHSVTISTTLVVVFTITFALSVNPKRNSSSKTPTYRSAVDNDWFMLQRVYPNNDVHPHAYEEARRSLLMLANAQNSSPTATWQLVGPTNIGGRITAIALHPAN